MRSRMVRPFLAVVLLGISSLNAGAQRIDTPAARIAVDSWLTLLDSRNYTASWETASSPFRAAVTAERWHGAASAVREPLGTVKRRTLKSATPATSLPGAPDGEYVVFQFDTAFAQKAAAVETVTAARERDGLWRVAGYFVR